MNTLDTTEWISVVLVAAGWVYLFGYLIVAFVRCPPIGDDEW